MALETLALRRLDAQPPIAITRPQEIAHLSIPDAYDPGAMKLTCLASQGSCVRLIGKEPSCVAKIEAWELTLDSTNYVRRHSPELACAFAGDWFG